MTEQTKTPNPKLVALLAAMKPVRSAANKLLSINERAADKDGVAAALKEQMMKVLNGSTEGEQDLIVLSKDSKKAAAQAAKIRTSAGVHARDLLKAKEAFGALVDELVAGIPVASDDESLGEEDADIDTTDAVEGEEEAEV